MLASGCAGMINSEPVAVVACGSVYHYSRADRDRAAADLEGLASGSPLPRMVGNHGAQQAENRACKSVQSRGGGP
jgi:hypothetical protein